MLLKQANEGEQAKEDDEDEEDEDDSQEYNRKELKLTSQQINEITEGIPVSLIDKYFIDSGQLDKFLGLL